MTSFCDVYNNLIFLILFIDNVNKKRGGGGGVNPYPHNVNKSNVFLALHKKNSNHSALMQLPQAQNKRPNILNLKFQTVH